MTVLPEEQSNIRQNNDKGGYMTVDVVIPVYRPDEKLQQLYHRLQRQKYAVRKLIIIETESEIPLSYPEEGKCLTEVVKITKKEYDHGGTRNMGARMSDADIVVFMTQDAVPADRDLIGNLVKALVEHGNAAVAYARQLPAKDCNTIENFTRQFNYPPRDRVQCAKDIEKSGIKAFFCSDVCAAYRKDRLLEAGGFEEKVIFNEDMIFAAKTILNGGEVIYVSDARVIHSHNYTAVQQFKRNFDLAVSQAQHPEVFAEVRSEGEGIRLVKQTELYLLRTGKFWLTGCLLLHSACKYAGYFLGKRYQRLPKRLILKCTSNKNYWDIY